MYQAILVPLDGSNDAEIVIPYVEEIAAKLSAEITLASVSESHATDTAHLYTAYLERIKGQVQREVKDFGGKEELKVFSTILLGKPASEILRYADEINAGLIVIASRGSSGQGRWFLGNVAAKVLRATSKPVLLIRTLATNLAIQQKKLVKKILVPLDGSPVGEAAIPLAEELAQALSAELVLFHVVEPLAIRAAGYETVPTLSAIVQEANDREAFVRTYLGDVEKRLKKKELSISSAIDSGSPADRIIDYAQANAIELIAMSNEVE